MAVADPAHHRVLMGFGNPLVDVNMETIVQRVTPDQVMGRVFGALEACLIGTMALGAAVMPALVHWLAVGRSPTAVEEPADAELHGHRERRVAPRGQRCGSSRAADSAVESRCRRARCRPPTSGRRYKRPSSSAVAHQWMVIGASAQ